MCFLWKKITVEKDECYECQECGFLVCEECIDANYEECEDCLVQNYFK